MSKNFLFEGIMEVVSLEAQRRWILGDPSEEEDGSFGGEEGSFNEDLEKIILCVQSISSSERKTYGLCVG